MSPTWVTILVAGAATFAMRASFIVAARHLGSVPPAIQRLLRQIPAAALASLVVPAVVRPNGTFDLAQPRFAAGALAGVVAWYTKSVPLTLIAGIGTVMALRAV